ncbi:MliC family protein [Pseudomonas sp. NPDC086278]|uniref:MliC family protein n=1 Tax=Pseudomonas sp. NPDC086278 TaxID=3390646 RepID=UPI003D051A6F
MSFHHHTLLIGAGLSALLISATAIAQDGPSFKCSDKMASSVEGLICKSPDLAKLDQTLAAAYSAAQKTAGNRANTLKAEQRGWIKGRDECWKSDDQQACIRDSYNQRIVEVQAGYGLVAAKGPFTFDCGSNGSISATFFQTDPSSINATYKGQQAFMVAVQSGSGVNYKGQNESFWEHQGEALVTWGDGAKQMTCKKKT